MTARLYKGSRFVADGWRMASDAETLACDDKVIVSLARWRAEQLQLLARCTTTGVRIGADESIGPKDDLAMLALVALNFPRFSDGRSYSKARVLREEIGYRGELRATGDVLLDQIPLMLRCGFDAFEIVHTPTIAALERGHVPGLAETYQATGAASARAWSRRAPCPCAAE